jgi:hypothetical protein
MISRAGFATFLSGNKRDATGMIVDALGVRREFDIAVALGVYPIPVGATGHMARQLSTEVLADPRKYYDTYAPRVEPCLAMLADESAGVAKWLDAFFTIIRTIAPK